jgi:hypothetical protein
MMSDQRLDVRDAYAALLLAIAEDYGVSVDPARLLDAADRVVLRGSREDIEAAQDLLVRLSESVIQRT